MKLRPGKPKRLMAAKIPPVRIDRLDPTAIHLQMHVFYNDLLALVQRRKCLGSLKRHGSARGRHHPNYILINPNFYQFAKKNEFPWLLTLTFTYTPKDDSGLPNDSISTEFEQVESELSQYLNRYTNSYFVYCFSWNGQRHVFFHLKDWMNVEAALLSWLDESQMEVEHEIAYERDWESTRAMLYLLFDANKN